MWRYCSLPFNASSLSMPRIHLIKPANLLSSIIFLWFHHPPSSLDSPVIIFFCSTQQPELKCHPPNAGFFQHDLVPRMASSQCAGKCLTTIQGRGELWFVAHADFHGADISAGVNFKLLVWNHWKWSYKEVCSSRLYIHGTGMIGGGNLKSIDNKK